MNQLISEKVKQNKGFTTGDIVIAIAIFTVFVGIMSSVFYNYYLTTTARNRNAIANNCVISIIENIKKMKYEDVDSNAVNLQIQNMKNEKKIPSGYEVAASIVSYQEMKTKKMLLKYYQ